VSLLLPEGARLLHIGPQKTGTTSIQAAMHRNRDELARHGVVYAGKGSRPRAPIWALVGMPDGSPAPPRRKWERFCEEVAAAGDQLVCISSESLGRIDLPVAREAVGGLGGDRTHVVAAARALDSLLPSQWQQRVRMRRTTLSFDDWLRVILGPDRSHPEAVNFWMPHDVGPLVARWVEATGSPERFTLIISDRGQPDLVPRAFEGLLGLPSGLLDLPEGETRNQSLGLGRTELIRLVTAASKHNDRPMPPTHPLMVRLTDTLKVAAPWPDETPLPRVPAWAAPRIAELGELRAAAAREAGVRVIGDPHALSAGPAAAPADADHVTRPAMVSAELAAAAVELVLDFAAEQEQAARAHRRRARRLRRRLSGQEANPAARDRLANVARGVLRRRPE